MTAPLRESEVAARRVAEAAKQYLKVPQPDSARPAYWQLRQEVKLYEEAERRALKEATS